MKEDKNGNYRQLLECLDSKEECEFSDRGDIGAVFEKREKWINNTQKDASWKKK